MTTSRPPGAEPASARTERTRKLGMAAVPATARAPLRRKNRRLVFIRPRYSLTKESLTSLKFGRAEQQSGEHLVMLFKIVRGFGRIQRSGDCCVRVARYV